MNSHILLLQNTTVKALSSKTNQFIKIKQLNQPRAINILNFIFIFYSTSIFYFDFLPNPIQSTLSPVQKRQSSAAKRYHIQTPIRLRFLEFSQSFIPTPSMHHFFVDLFVHSFSLPFPSPLPLSPTHPVPTPNPNCFPMRKSNQPQSP